MGTEKFYRIFGSKLANFREQASLTQAELARKVGISRASIANIERGEQRVYFHQFVSLAHALDLNSVMDLMPNAEVGLRVSEPVSVSGAKVSRAQEREIQLLVQSIASSSRRTAHK